MRSSSRLHVEGGADRAEGVVLVPLGQAEDGHHGVADELLDDAAVVLEDAAQLLEGPDGRGPAGLGVVAGRGAGRQVGEDDRQRPPAGLSRTAARDGVAALGAPRPRRVGIDVDRRAARRTSACGGLVAALDGRCRGRHAEEPGRHRRRAVLERDRRRRFDGGRRPDGLDRRCGEQRFEGWRHGFERGCEQEGAARHDPVPAAGFGEHDVARADPRPVGQSDAPRPFDPVVQVGQRRLALGDGPDGTERIRLAGDRQAEHGHHGVPDPLLDPAAVRLEDPAELVEVLVQDVPKRLGIEALGKGGRPLQVGDDHRHPVGALGGATVAEAGTAPRAVPPRRPDVTPTRGAAHPLHMGGDRPPVGQLRITSRRDRRPGPCR